MSGSITHNFMVLPTADRHNLAHMTRAAGVRCTPSRFSILSCFDLLLTQPFVNVNDLQTMSKWTFGDPNVNSVNLGPQVLGSPRGGGGRWLQVPAPPAISQV